MGFKYGLLTNSWSILSSYFHSSRPMSAKETTYVVIVIFLKAYKGFPAKFFVLTSKCLPFVLPLGAPFCGSSNLGNFCLSEQFWAKI